MAWKEEEMWPLALVCFMISNINVPSNTWWLDTNANIHVTNSLQALRNLKRLSEGEMVVRLENRDKVQVEQIRVISLYLFTTHFLKLKNVIFLPFMKRNLISIVYLDQKGYSCHFGNNKFKLFYDSYIVGTSTLSDGLYKI